MLWAIYAIDNPATAAALRAEHGPAHVDYFTANQSVIFVSGPQQSDDGSKNIGSIFIINVPSREAAQAFLDAEPLYRSGVFESVRLTRMRRGRFFNPQLGDV